MAKPKLPNQAMRTQRRSRGSSLLLLAGIPLVILHAGLLLERAMQREALDPVVLVRWALAVALLGVLKGLAARIRSLHSPTLGIAAILIFALIHAPVAATKTGLPLAATGFGLALSLAIFDRRRDSRWTDQPMTYLAQRGSWAFCALVTRETLKDRAPPVSR